MYRNHVKEKLKRGELVVGAMVIIPHPAVVEVLALAGFDFAMMDAEHGSYDIAAMDNMVRACNAAGILPAARVPVNEPQAMLPWLETGLLAVQAPHCITVEDARTLIAAARYPPIGARGVGVARTLEYGTVPVAEATARWNEEMLVIVQIEDEAAASNLDAMLALQGADVFAIGLADLSASMGRLGQPDHPEVQELVSSMLKRIHVAGKWSSVSAGSAQASKRYIDQDVQIFKFGDARMLHQQSKRVLEEMRSLKQGAGNR